MKSPGKLPPLQALRAFEAVARLGSVTAAADELFVTHSAVSQQVKILEASQGIALFTRQGRRLLLTAAGSELAHGANAALCAIAVSASRARQRANPRRLTITTLPSFAACWLTPRIGRFIEQEGGVEINIQSTSDLLDYARDGIDVGIRFGSGEYEGLDAQPLMRDEALVVASPAYVAQRAIARPADLAGCAMLRSDGESWAQWFAAAGLDWPDPETGLFFSDFALALTWAENGHGVALTRRSLADNALRQGKLVQLFAVTVADPRIYSLVTPRGSEPTVLRQRFCDWLCDEVRALPLALV